jgi:hypothetical protein
MATPRRNPDNDQAKKQAYREKLKGMTVAELHKETKDKIWFSAYAASNTISCYHWQCDFAYEEWVRRDGNADGYSKAHKEVMRAEGY